MPEPAPRVPLTEQSPPVEVAPVEVAASTWRRHWDGPDGLPATGTISLTRVGRPAMTVTADLVDGWLRIPLSPGRYRLVAALRTAAGDRFYDTDMISID